MAAKTTARNVALVGASGSGKTTLLESMLFVSGAVGRKGSVADGTTVSDASAESRARQMSTEISVAGFTAHGLDFTILDCPGPGQACASASQRDVVDDLGAADLDPAVVAVDGLGPIVGRRAGSSSSSADIRRAAPAGWP